MDDDSWNNGTADLPVPLNGADLAEYEGPILRAVESCNSYNEGNLMLCFRKEWNPGVKEKVLSAIPSVDINTNILKISFFEKIFGTSSTNGLLLIANSLLIAFVIYYAVKLAYSNYTNQPVESPHHFVFRLLILGISINSSFFICEQILNINHLLSSSIQELGQSIFQQLYAR